ncbi:hypothetical protein GALMADRAFT_216738 [Galerina marginata CBS 339.88]|uniref:Uncharacterized protein n=1 Tax=Galerina marginata (strain CBS 339.88) TaxID=685588 RepID=A0A067SJ98_GALM3|nr:hypothetical protein GALMADRAFT_216738 [Galerina marginata CBS 339.88]
MQGQLQHIASAFLSRPAARPNQSLPRRRSLNWNISSNERTHPDLSPVLMYLSILAISGQASFHSVLRPGQKPVPFIPVLDASFEVWFKKDSLWPAEDIDAVFDQDPQCVCILEGPVAAKWSVVKDEPVKDLLGNINKSLIQRLLERKYAGDASSVPSIDYLAVEPEPAAKNLPGVVRTESGSTVTFEIGSQIPDALAWLETLSGSELSWIRALLTSTIIVQGTSYIDNPLRRILAPRAEQKVVVKYAGSLPKNEALPSIDIREKFVGPGVAIKAEDVEQFCAVVGNQGGSFKTARNENVQAPMDFAIVWLAGQRVIEVVSAFLYRGRFVDYENTFDTTEEPDYSVLLENDAAVGILHSKEWFDWENSASPLLAGTTLIFRIQSQVAFKDRTAFRNMSVTGDIFVRNQLKVLVKVGSVDFQQDDSHGNPVLATHGLWSSLPRAAMLRILSQKATQIAYDVNFVGMVLPGDALEVKLRHIGMRDGHIVVSIETTNDRGEKVLQGSAEVSQPPTVYVFTGQGSQEPGMGMDLYNSSPAARAVWDGADAHLMAVYGFSIVEIVKDNPKEKTIHFGGIKGQAIRQDICPCGRCGCYWPTRCLDIRMRIPISFLPPMDFSSTNIMAHYLSRLQTYMVKQKQQQFRWQYIEKFRPGSTRNRNENLVCPQMQRQDGQENKNGLSVASQCLILRLGPVPAMIDEMKEEDSPVSPCSSSDINLVMGGDTEGSVLSSISGSHSRNRAVERTLAASLLRWFSDSVVKVALVQQERRRFPSRKQIADISSPGRPTVRP